MLNQNQISEYQAVVRPVLPYQVLYLEGRRAVIEEIIAFAFCESDPKYKYIIKRQVVKFLKVWRGYFGFLLRKKLLLFQIYTLGGWFCESTMKKILTDREEIVYPESYIHEASCYFAFYPSGMELSLSFWTSLTGSTLSTSSNTWCGMAAVIRTGDGYVRSNIFSHKRGKNF